VPRPLRPLILLLLFAVGLSMRQPFVVSATTLPDTLTGALDGPALMSDAWQLPTSSDRPGPMVQQAFGLLMDNFVTPPDSGNVLNGGLDSAHFYLEKQFVADPLAQRPSFTGERRADWQLFLPAYARMVQALGDKGSRVQLDQTIVDGMAKSFKEQHTYYMTPDEFSQLQDDLQNNNRLSGIGVSFGQDFVITDVFEDTPAEKAGLMPGDRVIAVNGVSTDGIPVTEVSTKIRGDAGTNVTLTLQRDGVAAPIEKTLTRAIISIQWVRAKILDSGIGYLRIQTFAGPDALPIFNQAMQKFIDADVRALVIDVRNNTGGVVVTGEEIASRLIPDDRPLFRQIDRRLGEHTVTSWGEYWNRDIPMAILTNENSASMSEILASALQENGIARVIGTKTAGAVAAGVPYSLVDGSGLLVTVQTITSGQGKVLNEVGLDPDDVVPLDLDQLRQGKDNQLDAALNYVKQQANQRGPAKPGA
jgi:carboxyl-terminal processing protease